ncbi:uncharacterized protein CANTADRAFT_136472 [Suhomyces tanzawaensis NRRL Y-17324]|uniref:Uncharacterized protein n=1 Tax=Suhomyces tanzawaensis NRRL Y-17324 TaxID=984487 RepID=A0A1E4SRS1_9ASCO|nr:uncharacterized protein CANTADRAFT_136472 [Suhomyces tanzawaensis NRRL Y-17324]ODV82198.1 hypothetical protein CANTADRAFT_136472 [Suhomyces tanzawaensis NRRL Y-17324]
MSTSTMAGPESSPIHVPAPESQGPNYITSLDCKILQYKYSIIKLELVIDSIQKLILKCTPKPDSVEDANASEPPVKIFDFLPLIHYVVLLTGSLFSINDSAFQARLELLASFKLVKTSQITISTAVSHIPYDHQDTNVTPLSEIPKIPTALKCLKILEILANTCLQGYQKRFSQAKVEALHSREPLPLNYYDKLDSLIKNSLFDSKSDVDLTLKDTIFSIPRDDQLLQNENFIEATLVDMDFKMLFLITKNLQANLDRLRPMILRYKTIKTNIRSLPDHKYSLHKIFLLTLRLNDLYSIFRKFGRKIYLSNYQHLTDQKLLFQSSNLVYFKLNILNSMEDIFNSAKKNGTVIANLTRFIRPSARFEVTLKTINDFSNFASQTCTILESNIQKFEEFGMSWITAELRFRKVYQLPRKNLVDIYQSLQEVKSNDQPPAISVASASSPAVSVSPKVTEAFPSVNNSTKGIEKKLKKLDFSDSPQHSTRPSRSSSVSSVNSNNSISLGRRGSLSSPKRNSLIIPPTSNSSLKVSPTRPRPNSMLFLNSNNSLSNLDTEKTEKVDSPVGRRRSNSQPTVSDAASGAASALNNSFGNSKAAVKRSPSLTRKTAPVPTPAEKPPTSSSKVQNQLLAVAEEDSDEKVKAVSRMSANQRLQQHLRKAARTGSLMTQEKEQFTSVTFDPNNPSATNLRRPTEHSSLDEEIPATSPAPVKSGVPIPTGSTLVPTVPLTKIGPSRDQVTRRNTKRNSVSSPISDISPNQSTYASSASSTNSSGVTKKVRFTGVAEYTEAEDAPSKYSNRILKNFAVFRSPTINYAFKKKDQILKREESISFRHHLEYEGEDPNLATATASVPVNRFTKIKSKLL